MARPQRVISKQVSLPERPKRPVKNIEPEGPCGAWMKNPPATCLHAKVDSDGVWVECVMCHYHCKDNKNCNCYAVLKVGAKDRIKASGR